MAFPNKSGEAFVLLAADGMSSGGYSFLFRRIDVKQVKPQGDGFTVLFDGMALGGDEFAKPEGLTTLTRFGGRAVPAGDYALIGRIDLVNYGNFTDANVNCFSRGAAVFHFEPDKIALVAAGSVRSRRPMDMTSLPTQAGQVLHGYPRITAPVSIAAPTGTVTFTTEKSFLGTEVCKLEDGFSFAPSVMQGQEDARSAIP